MNSLFVMFWHWPSQMHFLKQIKVNSSRDRCVWIKPRNINWSNFADLIAFLWNICLCMHLEFCWLTLIPYFIVRHVATSEFPVRTEHSWGSESGNQISHQLFTDTTEWSPDCPCKMPWVAGWSLTMKSQILIDQSVSGWVRPADRTVLREGGSSPLKQAVMHLVSFHGIYSTEFLEIESSVHFRILIIYFE